MKILVTGHRGLLGSACVRRLSPNHEIIKFEGDLLDYYQFRNWLGQNKPDAIIHCAAKVGGVGANSEKPVEFLTINLKIQSTVIESAAFFGIPRLIFIGTSCMFPKNAAIPVREDSLLTGPFDKSVESYAIAKLAGHSLCCSYRKQYGFQYTTVCPSNIYGVGDFYGKSAHVIPALIQKVSNAMKTHSELEVWGDGTAIREFIYCDDAADAIERVMLDQYNQEIVSIGSGEPVSIKQLVSDILYVAGAEDLKVKWNTSMPTGIQEKTFDVSRIKQTGWIPKVNLKRGLILTWNDFASDYNIRYK